MAVFTPEKIGMVAWNAGFGRDEPTLARAIAVALAESDGRTDAFNDDASTGDLSYGLWQINMIGAMGPERRKAFGIAKNDELFDPQKNANAAWKVSNSGRNWTPWSTFKDGKYLKHIPTGEAAAKKLAGMSNDARNKYLADLIAPGAVDAKKAVEDAAASLDVPGAIRSAMNSLTQSVLKLGLNAGVILLAIVLIVLGAVILMREPLRKAATGTAKVAGAVAPQGRVANVAGKAAKAL